MHFFLLPKIRPVVNKSGIISIFALLVFQILSPGLMGQGFPEGGKTRHRFAQTHVGISYNHGPAGHLQNYRTHTDGTVETFHTRSLREARLLIGGIHFWGHADFQLAIPLLRDKAVPFRTGVETGARIYPFRLRNNRVVPFAGISFVENEYQIEDGPALRWYAAPISAGITYLRKNNLIELFAVSDFSRPSAYYISPGQTMPVEFPGLRAGISYKRVFDMTRSAEKQWESGETKRFTDTLAVMKRLNGITIGAGPSSAFFLRRPVNHGGKAPYLGHHRNTPLLADLTLGYYFHRPDVQFQFAFRTMQSRIRGYGSTATLRRTSFAAEGYKFLFDYHGFCFFAGPSISKESWTSTSAITGFEKASSRIEKIQPGIVFGWDIRPNRLQSMYLRTHLRWFPGMHFREESGKKVRMDQLEFNYIQLVIFPGRMF